MNFTQALEFAKSSAATAFDQRDAYDDAQGSYFDNLRDTIADEARSLTSFEIAEIEAAYSAEVSRLFTR